MYCKNFSELSRHNAGIAGGKGASLGEMTNAGIPVPPGFVVVADAFEKFLEETDLNVEIDSILHGVDTKAMHTIEHASETIQKLILEAKMPEDIAREILQSFDSLRLCENSALGVRGNPEEKSENWVAASPTPRDDTKEFFVAVRSSATAEDSASAAWAGQLDSFLNTTEESLLKNVQRCWASLFTPRAIFYRFEQGLHDSKISVAVVVQKMVESEVSGIAFSVHPVTEDYNQLIIEAGYGLGEAIVSGQITPDSYVVEKTPRRIIDTNIVEQERGIYRSSSVIPDLIRDPESSANEWSSIPSEKRNQQKLSNEQILELSEIIIGIEKHYGFPCDIEWAFENDKFYIVQSRPITTLAPLVASPTPDVLKSEDYTYVGYYKCSIFANWFWTAWYSDELAKKIDLKIDFGGYTGYAGGHSSLHKQTIQQLGDVLHAKIEDGDLRYFDEIVALADDEFASAMRFADSIQIEKDALRGTFEEVVTHARRMMFFWWIGWQFSEIFDETLKNEAMKSGISEGDISVSISQPDTPLIRQQAEVKNLKRVLEDRGIWELLKRDVAGAIEKINESPDLSAQFREHIEKYEWIQMINWVGDKLTLEKLLEQMTYLKTEEEQEKATVPDSFKLYADVASRISYIRQAGAEYSSMFENKALPVLEALAKEVGVSVRDMLNLLPEEFFSGPDISGDISEKIEKRRKDKWFIYVDRDNSVKSIEDIDTADTLAKSFIPIAEEGSSNELRGNIGNKGKAIGPARVILATEDFHKMQEGDVLVTPMTTPDFVLLMQKSSAIVTDMGGLLCHAAIVSRELNKPCIIGTNFGTQVLHDGDLVEVDADNGVVRIIERAGQKWNPKVADSSVMERIKNTDWHQDWSDLYSPIEASLDMDSYFGVFEKTCGVSFFHVMLFFDGEKTTCWSPIDESEKIGTHLARKMLDPVFLKQWVVDFKSHADMVSAFVRLPLAEFLAHLPEYREKYPRLAPYVIGTKLAFNLLPMDHDDVASALESSRKYTEMLYKDSTHVMSELCRFISEQEGYEAQSVRRLTMDELCDYGKSGILPDEHVLQERLKAEGIYLELGVQHALSLDDVMEIRQSWRAGVSDNVLKGVSAYPGLVKGRCRIVFDYRNASFAEGEVLVATMTDPRFVPFMKKAAAIVTDGGGMLSHAAIVARELKIPCVVGTKLATQILHDGDLIEVNADNGVVRILEKAANAKPTLSKFLERDTTLVMQSLFSRGLVEDIPKVYEFDMLYLPMEIHYATEVNVQIWENEKGNKWLVEKLLEKNLQGADFIAEVERSYKPILAKIEKFWQAGAITDTKALAEYLTLVQAGALRIAICFYVGLDERTPKEVQDIVVKMREKDELFARSDEYIRDCIEARGGNRNLAHLVLAEEFIGELPTEKELEKRSKGFVLIDGRHAFEGTLETYAEMHLEIILKDLRVDESIGQDILCGQTAFGGKAIGRVRIIKNRKQATSVALGDIIVAPMTTPDFLPAMKLAAAFVTDEGGVTCHAAIIAREMKKPCIIGTKIATQVLKDGDLVEVDADNGVVRIIEQLGNDKQGELKKLGVSMIPNREWFKFIERSEHFFVYTAFARTDSYMLRDVLGFGFPESLYRYQNGLGANYRDREVYQKANEYFFSLMDSDDPRILKCAEEGVRMNQFADQMLKRYKNPQELERLQPSDFRECFDATLNILLYGCTIPYLFLESADYAKSINKWEKRHEKHIKALEPLRAVSKYFEFEELVLSRFFEFVADTMQLKDHTLARFLMPDEIEQVFSGVFIITEKDLKHRSEWCVFWTSDGGQHFEFLYDRKIMQQYHFFIDPIARSADEFPGTVAYRGKIQGRVRIVNTKAEMMYFTDSEILVSQSTNPMLMPVILKCGAIVTDEGGMASHAAIIAREMKKPCIIGTKFATQVLRDGDLVEVDADHGVVRILDKS